MSPAPSDAAHEAQSASQRACEARKLASYEKRAGTKVRGWPVQDIRSHRGCCARINHPFIPPAHLHCSPGCNSIARLLDSIRLPFRPPVCMLYTIQYW